MTKYLTFIFCLCAAFALPSLSAKAKEDADQPNHLRFDEDEEAHHEAEAVEEHPQAAAPVQEPQHAAPQAPPAPAAHPAAAPARHPAPAAPIAPTPPVAQAAPVAAAPPAHAPVEHYDEHHNDAGNEHPHAAAEEHHAAGNEHPHAAAEEHHSAPTAPAAPAVPTAPTTPASSSAQPHAQAQPEPAANLSEDVASEHQAESQAEAAFKAEETALSDLEGLLAKAGNNPTPEQANKISQAASGYISAAEKADKAEQQLAKAQQKVTSTMIQKGISSNQPAEPGF